MERTPDYSIWKSQKCPLKASEVLQSKTILDFMGKLSPERYNLSKGFSLIPTATLIPGKSGAFLRREGSG